MSTPKKYRSFEEFYPFYLSQHQNRICRGLHYIGSALALLLVLLAIIKQIWWLLPLALVSGYAFAWVGHFFFEKNRPATFIYPWYSFIGDWRMLKDFLTGSRTKPS